MQISFTQISDFRRCHRLWYYKSVIGARPVGDDLGTTRRDFGKLFHEALAAYHGSIGNNFARADCAVQKWNEISTQLTWEQQVSGHTLLLAYATKWGNEPEIWDNSVTCDAHISMPVLDPSGSDSGIVLFGKLDLIAIHPDGYEVIYEHKTTSKEITGSAYWSNVERSLQASIYLLLSYHSGHNVSHVLWDVIRTPRFARIKATPEEKRERYKVGPKKGEWKDFVRLTDEGAIEYQRRVANEIAANPADWFARNEISRNERELFECMVDVWGDAVLMERSAQEPYPAVSRNPERCYDFGRPCEYYGVCWENKSINDEKLYTLRTKND